MQRLKIFLILGLFVLSLASTIWGEEVEIGGLIIDQTQTRIGHDFYLHFVTFWLPPEGIEDYNIFIIERASPHWGNWIWIKVNMDLVYRNMLKPRSEEIEEEAKKGVAVIRGYLYQKYKKEVKEEDMIGEGM